ncbi:MAG: tetratricopeptide repeat protein [Pseudomonadota bacterium]
MALSALLLCGCVGPSLPPPVLAGSLDSALGLPAAAVAAEDPFYLSDNDRRWLAARIDRSWSEGARFRALLELFEDDGELALEYDLSASTSATHTLAARRGNCLSFTVLFVALARELDINAQVQEVSIPAAWARLGDVAVANRHVVAWGRIASRAWEVDFGRFTVATTTPRRLLSDREVRAVLASNQGASLLATADDGLPLLRAALRVDEDLAQGWGNLGVGLARLGDLAGAEYAFRRALEHEPGDASALSGLLRLYREIDPATAETLEVVMPRLVSRSPWVRYNRGQQALTQGDLAAALRAFEAAVRTAPDEPWFHLAVVRTRAGMGDRQGAKRALRRAERALRDEAQYALLVEELLELKRQMLAVAGVGPDKLGTKPPAP